MSLLLTVQFVTVMAETRSIQFWMEMVGLVATPTEWTQWRGWKLPSEIWLANCYQDPVLARFFCQVRSLQKVPKWVGAPSSVQGWVSAASALSSDQIRWDQWDFALFHVFFFKLISTTHPPHRARVCLLFPPLRTADMGWAVGLKKGLAGVRRRMERKWAGERKKMFIRSDDGGVGLHWHCHALVQVAVRLLFFPRIASTAR